MSLPTEIVQIIEDYRNGMEHYQRFQKVLPEIHGFWYIRSRSRMNMEFQSIYFPGFFANLIWDPFPHLQMVIPLLEEAEPEDDLAA